MLVDYVAVWTTGTGGTNPTTTTTTGSGWNACGEIQAEQATSRSGGTIESTSDTGGGQDVGKLKNGDWLRFPAVRFDSTTAIRFTARAASGAGGSVSGLVEVRLGGPTATPVGSFAIANTGGWQSWRTVPANMGGVTGTQDVYLTFTSGQPSEYVSINWIKFS
nr:carbohydrate-binding protein [Saccharothrix syringae]